MSCCDSGLWQPALPPGQQKKAPRTVLEQAEAPSAGMGGLDTWSVERRHGQENRQEVGGETGMDRSERPNVSEQVVVNIARRNAASAKRSIHLID